MSVIISADELKKNLPNYSPDRAEEFHHESAVKADKLFTKTVKETLGSKVILLNGGTASGKTEFLSTHLMQEDCIVFDATQSTELGAKIKLEQIIKARKTPIIYSVIPDNLKRAFIAFLNRDRKFSDKHFYKTHVGSRKTLLWIATNYPTIQINIIESSYTIDGKLQFSQIKFEKKQNLMNYLAEKQMSEDDIISYINFLK